MMEIDCLNLMVLVWLFVFYDFVLINQINETVPFAEDTKGSGLEVGGIKIEGDTGVGWTFSHWHTNMIWENRWH